MDGYLHCSCNEFQINGLPCAHFYCILSGLACFKEPSHHHCAVRWWAPFYHYGCNPSPQNKTEKDISNLLRIQQKNDIKGFPILKREFAYVPIDLDFKNDLNWEIREFPRISNYPSLVVGFESHDIQEPLGLSQHIHILNNDYEEDQTHIEMMHTLESNFNLAHQTCTNSDNVYKDLVPVAKELVNVMEHNCDPSEITEIKKYLFEKIAFFRHKAECKNPPATGKTVSSGVIQNKRLKTHGCNSFRR